MKAFGGEATGQLEGDEGVSFVLFMPEAARPQGPGETYFNCVNDSIRAFGPAATQHGQHRGLS